MYKKVISVSMLTASLLFSGCGNDETSCRIDVQQSIDEGDFTTAISKLEGECSTTFSDSDKYFYLASAYMGQSGFGVSDAVSMVVTASDSVGGNTFSAFMQSVNENKSANALPLLDKSATYFLLSIDPNATIADCTNDANRTQREDNACLYVGFNQAITTATSMTYLTSDVDTLVASIEGSTGTTPDDMKASLDAIAWATNSTLPNGSVINDFNVTINGTDYKHLEVSVVGGGTFYRLASSTSPSDTNGSTIVTSGYCDLNGSTTLCEGIENLDGSINDTTLECYACPVDFGNGDTKDMTQLLVDALNGGTDAISGVIDDPDIQQSIDEFKTDMNVNADANVTIQDILNYLNQ
ncbi:hypothetical protein [Sulfurimonas microaerophilic]|uniref:hypothetical protein n=1 Tax=Sulfurimonas microaerophilic TaxID=3058392 RepID=UPI0027155421|nr:hypothetical protein [Sulfurimonas sp. hsl 1-7]